MNYQLTKDEDQKFMMILLRDIPYFHHLYAKYHDPKSLEIAKTLGEVAKDLKNKIQNHVY